MKKITTILLSVLFGFSGYSHTLEKEVLTNTNGQNDTVVSISEDGKHIIQKTTKQNTFTVYYKLNSSEIDKTYLTNAAAFDMVERHLRDSFGMAHLDSLSLNAISSLDGRLSYNIALSERRANSLYRYLSNEYPYIKDKIKVSFSGEDWDGLRAMVVESNRVPNKQEVLTIIDSEFPLDTKELHLKQLDNGSSWKFISENMLKFLRYGASAIFHYDIEYLAAHEEPILTELSYPETKIDTLVIPKMQIQEPEPETYVKPVLAFKTNLLFDVASVLNIGIEIPIGNRISIEGEYIFPWWYYEPENVTVRTTTAHVGINYWLGNRENRERLTGWSLGLYGGWGEYDFQLFSESGVQGEMLNGGLSIGYSHAIGKSFNLQYQVGVGYLQTDYKNYQMMYDTKYGNVKVFEYPWEVKRRTIIGPT